MKGAKLEKIADSMLSLVKVFHLMKGSETSGGKAPFLDPKYWVLGFLMKGDLSMSELGERMQRSKPNMTAIIDSLIGEGKVRRVHSKGDRRVVMVSITEKGRHVMHQKKEKVKGNIKVNLSVLGEQDIARLCDSMKVLDEIAEKMVGRHD